MALSPPLAAFALLVALLAGARAVAADPSDEITVPDPALLTCINAELGQDPSDAVTQAQAASIDELFCENRGVGHITGIEHFTGLVHLLLGSNDISDIDALAALTSLETLRLDDNHIADIAVLADMTALAYLSVGHNDLHDMGAVADMTALETLILSGNDIEDLTPLAGLTSLEQLFLEGAGVEELSPIGGLTTLEKLALTGNDITDVSALVGLSSIRRLYLDDNSIEDVGPLAALTSLVDLDLDGNHIVDISALAPIAPVLVALNVEDQLVHLGQLGVGIPFQNPVVDIDGLPVPLDELYDAATNSFTPLADGPDALTWATGDGSFSGTLTFDPVEVDDDGTDPGGSDDGGPDAEVDVEDDPEPEDDTGRTGEVGENDAANGGGNAPQVAGTSTHQATVLPATGVSPLTMSLAGLAATLILAGTAAVAVSRRRA